MAWTRTFNGTRHEIVAEINSDSFSDAQPLHAIRQFIGAQLPSMADDPIEMREYRVTASGGTSSSDGHVSANLFVSVTRGQVRPEPMPNPPVKQQEETADAA